MASAGDGWDKVAMELIRLTGAEFDRLAAKTRLEDRARAAARAVLVDGVDRLSHETGESRQFVTQALKSMQAAFDREPEMGAMVSTTLTVRAATARKLQDLAHLLEQMPMAAVEGATLAAAKRPAGNKAK